MSGPRTGHGCVWELPPPRPLTERSEAELSCAKAQPRLTAMRLGECSALASALESDWAAVAARDDAAIAFAADAAKPAETLPEIPSSS